METQNPVKASLETAGLITRLIQLVHPNAVVQPARKDREEDYLYAVFMTAKSWLAYQDGYDTEDMVIWYQSVPVQPFGFSYEVYDPGVRYHSDGSGTPPSSEMWEYAEKYNSLKETVSGLVDFLLRRDREEKDGMLRDALRQLDENLTEV